MPLLRACLASTFGFLAFSANAAPTSAAQVDAAIKSMTDMASHTFGKSVSFCVASHLPAGQPPLDGRLDAYIAAIATGSREAMLEIAAKDSSFINEPPVLSAQELAMVDKQADAMLQGIRSAPEANCTKLGTVLDSGSAAFFRQFTLQGYQEYLGKRAQYCDRVPKPANCK